MEKPKRPKKPIVPQVQEPRENVIEYLYPYEHYPNFDSNRPQLVFYRENEIPDEDDLDPTESDAWLDANRPKAQLSLQKLVDYATSRNLSLSEVEVGAINLWDDRNQVEIKINRNRTEAEMITARNQYNEAMAAYHAKLSEYEDAMVTYPRRKAEYELWLAQEKLNQLQS